MSFRQIFDRVTRIARSGSFDPFEDSFDDELRRAQAMIDAEKRREEEMREAEQERLRREKEERDGTSTESGTHEEGASEPVVDPEIAWALNLLGVTAGASPQEITNAYRRRIVEVHPDRHQRGDDREADSSKRQTQDLNRAYTLVKAWRTRKG